MANVIALDVKCDADTDEAVVVFELLCPEQSTPALKISKGKFIVVGNFAAYK